VFVELEERSRAKSNVPHIDWFKKINRPGDVLKKGDTIDSVVINVIIEKHEIVLGIKQLEKIYGKVKKITSYGAIVELDIGIYDMVHISRISEEQAKK
jgi:small subunit ribosomal protein S1